MRDSLHSLILSGEQFHEDESNYVAADVHGTEGDGRLSQGLRGIEVAQGIAFGNVLATLGGLLRVHTLELQIGVLVL